MSEKRFTINDYPDAITDNFTGKEYRVSSYYTHMEIICVLLNELDEDNKQYKILVESLKDENQKLKLRLKDLGVEYY